MIIYNPNKYKVEFLHGGVRYFMDAYESRTFPDLDAEWILDRTRIGLVKYHPSYDVRMTKTDMDYNLMNWSQLVKLASARGIFKPSMKKDKLLELLKEYDAQRGIVQEPSNQETGERA